jgi:hypothetical protein
MREGGGDGGGCVSRKEGGKVDDRSAMPHPKMGTKTYGEGEGRVGKTRSWRARKSFQRRAVDAEGGRG